MGRRDDMALPEGKSCADCTNFNRCVAFIGPKFINDKSTHCDWSPSRFRLPASPPPATPLRAAAGAESAGRGGDAKGMVAAVEQPATELPSHLRSALAAFVALTTQTPEEAEDMHVVLLGHLRDAYDAGGTAEHARIVTRLREMAMGDDWSELDNPFDTAADCIEDEGPGGTKR